MVDKNGIEIKTGMIVEITGAYFKNDNGLYFVDRSPRDPSWIGSDYSLKKISKTGKISRAKYSTCFWPIMVFTTDRCKAAEAHRWNEIHAQIEVKTIKNMAEVAAHFEKKAEDLTKYIHRSTYDFGEDSPHVVEQKAIQAHYRAVAASIFQQKGGPQDE